jgi:hypothetical protein
MSYLIFLSENYVDEANLSLNLGTANAQFPLSNIKNQATVKKFRSVENSIKIVIDLQQTRSIDSIAITGDATQTLGITTASIKLSLTTDFTGFTAVPVPIDAQYGMGYYMWSTMQSYRYAELTITGNGTFCELSNIFIGERIELLQNAISISSFSYSYKDNSSVANNDYGQKFINVRNNVKVLAGSIDYCNRDEQELLDNMLIRHQIHLPIWMIVDKESSAIVDGNYKLSVYGYVTNAPKWGAAGGKHFNTDISIQQAI